MLIKKIWQWDFLRRETKKGTCLYEYVVLEHLQQDLDECVLCPKHGAPHATPTPQTQTKWLLCKILLAVKVCVWLQSSLCSESDLSGVSHTPWPKKWLIRFSERKRNSYSSKTKLDVRFAVDSQPGTFVLCMLSHGHLSLACFLSQHHSSHPWVSRELLTVAKVASASISAALEDSPSATLGHSVKGRQPHKHWLPLGPYQREAVNSVLTCLVK